MGERLSWGCWELDPEKLCLQEPSGYLVDLERLTSTGEVLDAIAQVAGKTLGSPDALGSLVMALDDLLSLQAHYCPDGRNQTLGHAQVRELVQQRVEAIPRERAWEARVASAPGTIIPASEFIGDD